MTMEATYGKMNDRDNYLLTKDANPFRTLPLDGTSRRSTVLVRARPDDHQMTMVPQRPNEIHSGRLSHHRQCY